MMVPYTLLLLGTVCTCLRIGFMHNLPAASINIVQTESLKITTETRLPLIEIWLQENNFDVIYDESQSRLISYYLRQLRDSLHYTHIISWNSHIAEELGVISAHRWRDSDRLKVSLEYLERIGVKEIVLLSMSLDSIKEASERLVVVSYALMTSGMPQSAIDRVVSIYLRSSGVRSILLNITGDLLTKVLASLSQSKLLTEGYLVLCTTPTTTNKTSGLLMVAEEGTDSSVTVGDHVSRYFNWLFADQIFSEAELVRKIASNNLLLINQAASKRVIAGKFDGRFLNMSSQVNFFGGLSSYDFSSPIKINISAISTAFVSAARVDRANMFGYYGFKAALAEIDELNFLGKHKIILTELSCAANGSTSAVARNCVLANKSKIASAVAMFGTYSSDATKNHLETMYSQNLTQPYIGVNSAGFLEVKATYPNYVRVIQPSTATVPAYVLFLKRYKYSKVQLFYTNDPTGIAFGNYTKNSLEKNGIEVVNPEANRTLPTNLTVTPDNFTAFGEMIMSPGIRPIIHLTSATQRATLIDYLSLLGTKAGEFIMIYDIFADSIFLDISEEKFQSRLEIAQNSFYIEQASYIGSEGERANKVIAKYTQQSKGITNQCYSFDSAYLFAVTVKRMLDRGKDFTNSTLLNQELRKTIFIGCSGKISIEPDTNNRSSQEVDISSLRAVDGKTSSVKLIRVSLINTQIFTDFAPIIWPGGSSSPPKENRLNYEDCPFAEEMRQNFNKGIELARIVGLCLVLMTLGLSGVVLHKLRFHRMEVLEHNYEESFNDMLVKALVVFDMFQYVTVGPKLSNGQDLLERVTSYLSDGFINSIDLTSGVYWKIMNSLLSVVLVWLLFCVLLWLRYKNFEFRRLKWLTNAGEKLMPILGNALYMPIIAILFDVYYCEEAQGEEGDNLDYTDSFMYRDCSETCWKGTHAKYAIVVSICLMIYHPVTVVTRPLWQELQTDTHIKTNPFYYFLKSIVEIAIVVIRRAFRKTYPFTHAIFFSVLIIIYGALCFWKAPFNYNRLNLWFQCTIGIMAWTGIVAALQTGLPVTQGFAGDGLLFSVIVAIIGISMYFSSKYTKSMLFTRKVRNFNKLLRFAFTPTQIALPSFFKNKHLKYIGESARELNRPSFQMSG
mmetsp:Transcript_16475/g.29718  ORF Transcript_16475/g.29718 Transcript_16475/m.29718 type:complete len:1126 (+) Transcript_16475:28-3405(+)